MSQIRESEKPMITAVFDDERAREWVDQIEVREGVRAGLKRPDARASLARKWGVSFWTLTNWRRGRLKDLRGAIRDKIHAGIVHELKSEITRLSDDLSLALQCGASPDSDAIVEAKVALHRARELLQGG
jgi:hypothetical protein